MEDPNPAQPTVTQIANPPNSEEALAPQPPPSSLPPKTKKRPLRCPYLQLQLLQGSRRPKEIRPYFLEVLRTPDFRLCKAANDIQEQVKLLMELYKQMTAEAVSTARCKNVPEGQPLSHEKSQDTRASGKPSENKFPSGVSSEKAEDGQIQGTYVVGGSAFGWNFITFLGNEPVYCGITKESFRANGSKATVP
ncbi:uncharacterized protein Pyn_23299 [Prunus yedoensis var. nudiflora]|uniref:Uncharacterized protein n=1 Tax=Prunus yedoensis var. nudiflora TaxID=2094558 RepID=A0A314Z1Z1_PRUYE|nr:uncharacterized protein Pyn_23299 [Prunus yedoensis var. nudiflora]